MNKQRQHRMQIRHAQQRLSDAMGERRYGGTTVEDDAKLDKGQLADAAAILLRYAADREKVRNLPKAVQVHDDYKKGNYTDLEQAGYPDTDPVPPANWPLKGEEWHHYNQIGVLEKAQALIAHELERLRIQHNDFYRHGSAALDVVEMQQIKKNAEVQQRKRTAAWKRRAKETSVVDVNVAGAVAGMSASGLTLRAAVPYDSADTAYANSIIDDLIDEGPFPGGEGG